MTALQFPELFQLANALYRKGMNDEEVKMQLKDKGAAETILHDIMEQAKKIRLTQKRNSGFLYCGIGVFLLVAGCMLTLFLFNNGGNIKFALYGITIIGITFTIKGLIDILGW